MLGQFTESLKEEKITGIEFASGGGFVIWREVGQDGPISKWEKTSLKDGDEESLRLFREELKEKYGEEVKI